MAEDLSGFSMLELFRLEAESQTAILSSGILAVEETQRSPETIEAMMRAAHSLKGAARIVGLEPAVQVAHSLEDCFVLAGKGVFFVGAEHVDLLLAAVDFLSSIAKAADALDPDAPWAARAASLVRDLSGLQSHGSTAPSTPGAPVAAAPTSPPPDPRPSPATPPPAVVEEPPQPVAATPQTAIASEPTESAKPAAARPIDQADRVVRVSAESLTRLVALAGESLVEARQLRPFVDSMLHLRGRQTELCDQLSALEERLRTGDVILPAADVELIARARAASEDNLARFTDRVEEFEAFARRNEDLSNRLHHEVIKSRMRPLADGIRGFPRMVRDLARKLGKQVRFEVHGDQTGVDRDILDKLEAPLSHLIRNALDHGLEQPPEREAAGKSPVGAIRLEARHRAGMLNITLVDDGRGIDVDALRRRAIDRGLVARAVADQLSEMELLEFLFLPGFSTKDVVTEISGRGVGLDVVQSMVKAVGGNVRIATQPGWQTTFTLQLPITMSVVRALLVEIGGEPYAFPLTRIDQIIHCRHSELRTVEGRQYFDRDGISIGLVMASQILEIPSSGPPSDPLPVVVVSDRGQQFGLIVDTYLGERDLEVRPLDTRLGKVPDINSASLLENGSPVLIVDVEDLVRSIDNVLAGRRLSRVEFERLAEQERQRKRVLVVDDSITVRELERQLLQSRGFAVDVAVDGMDGWNAIRSVHYDLIVTDVDMPRMDGIGLVALVKADPSRKDIPVVIVSYKDREEDRLRGLDAGANRYLTKSSFHDETFLNTIVDLIGEATQ
ncbi:MAG: hybrid sensor histidine kinase/response regulator [Pirellulales bacterium]|jgi:two-component system sensor histidine kinase and response regulator WspE